MAKFDPFLSLDFARVEGVGAQSKERKGSNFAAQRSGAIVQEPEGPKKSGYSHLATMPGDCVEGGLGADGVQVGSGQLEVAREQRQDI